MKGIQMPSNFEPVTIPPDLRPDTHMEDVPKKDRSEFWASLFALTLIIVGAAVLSLGMAWWVHPGAGVAILGLTVTCVGILIGYSR